MKTTTAAMNEWILRREINAYIKRRTCPFCGGTLSGRHPRAENGKILPMTYVCRQCGRNPREALAGETHEPAGREARPRGEAMSKSKTQKSTEKKNGGEKNEQPPDAARIEAARTPDVNTLGKGKVAESQTDEAPKGRVHTIAKPRSRPVTGREGRSTEGSDSEQTDPPESLVVFAFRLTRSERDEIHAATGSAKASRFVKAIVLAGARGDMKAVQETLDEIHSTSR